MMDKERITFIDVAKGIGIILVVCGHVMAEGNKPFIYSDILHEYIYSFHMALFFIIGGVLLKCQVKRKNEIDIDYVKHKTHSLLRGLLIPYFTWSLIYFILDNEILNRGIFEWIVCIMTFRGRAPIWFLGALFWAECFAVFLIYITKGQKKSLMIIALITAILSILSWRCYEQLDALSVFTKYVIVPVVRGVVCLLFVLLGYIISDNITKTENKSKTAVKLLIAIAISLTAYIVCGTENNLHTFAIGNMYSFIITGISGSCMVLYACKLNCEFVDSKGLEYIGQHSLGIMCIHYTHLPFMQYATDVCNFIGLGGGKRLHFIGHNSAL